MAKVRFIRTKKKKYLDRESYDLDALYFCEDTGEVFKGDKVYTDGIRVIPTIAELPSCPNAADGVVYYITETRNGYVMAPDRSGWLQTIYAPVEDISSVPEEEEYNVVATVGAVRDLKEQLKLENSEILNNAKTYTDDKISISLVDLKEEIRLSDLQTLSDSNVYTDEKISKLSSHLEKEFILADEEILNNAKDYTDKKFSNPINLNIKNGSGVGSVVSGDNNTASGRYSVAINHNNTASGNNSAAMGTTTIASGAGALSANCGTEATGDVSTAFGNYTKATSTYAFTAGDRTEANGVASVALNHNNKVFGRYGLATGSANTVGSANPVGDADGESSSAFGVGNEVTGRYSNSFGSMNKVSGKYSNSFGVANEVSGNYSNSQGYNQKNKGHFASTFGTGTETFELSENQAAFGKFNKAESDSLFMIGNGTSDTYRKNAFEVKSDGRVLFGDRNLIFQKGEGVKLSSGLHIQVGDLDDYATRLTSSGVRVGGPGNRVEISSGVIRLGEEKIRLTSSGSIWLGAAELTEAKVNAINLAGLPLHVIKYGDHNGMNKLSQSLPNSGTGEVTAICCYDTGKGVICAPLSFYQNYLDYHFTGVVFREKEYQLVMLRYYMVAGTWSVEFKPILSNSGMVLTSPNGTKFNVTVDDSGNLSAVQV